MSEKQEDLEKFNSVTCCTCGILFGFPKRIETEWRKTHKNFNCPNGHPLQWSAEIESEDTKELKKLRVEVQELKTKLEAADKQVIERTVKIAELTTELEIWRPSSATDKETNGSEQVRSGD